MARQEHTWDWISGSHARITLLRRTVRTVTVGATLGFKQRWDGQVRVSNDRSRCSVDVP